MIYIPICHAVRVDKQCLNILSHETCLQDIVVDLKRSLQIYNNILKTCFPG